LRFDPVEVLGGNAKGEGGLTMMRWYEVVKKVVRVEIKR